MPEGPEIRRAADRIEAAVGSRRAREVYFAFPNLKQYESDLSGETVRRIEPRGKALLIHFSNDFVVYTHSQLYGRWYTRKSGSLPATNRSLRFAIHNAEKSALLYSASQIDVLRAAEIDQHPYISKLGPDALAKRTTPKVIASRLGNHRFENRKLGALLLDQSFIAGLGNYLRCEILFLAGVHPDLRSRDLTGEERKKLARTIRTVSTRAYRRNGVTRAEANATRRRSQDRRHYVFARAGRPCPDCTTPIERATDAGRPFFSCPNCQPPR